MRLNKIVHIHDIIRAQESRFFLFIFKDDESRNGVNQVFSRKPSKLFITWIKNTSFEWNMLLNKILERRTLWAGLGGKKKIIHNINFQCYIDP